MFLRFRKKRTGDDLNDLGDGDLLLRYLESEDNEVIAVLFVRYTHLVYGVCLKYLRDPDDARDAVMEIFEELPEKLLRHDIRNFKSWLHTVTKNHCLMKLRHIVPMTTMRDLSLKNTVEDGMEFDLPVHHEDENGGITTEQMENAMLSLREPQRDCIRLVYLEGKSYQEVCEMTGYTYNEVKSHIQNGKRNLKIKLESYHAKEE